MAVALLAQTDDLTVGDIHGREESRRSMARVVMSDRGAAGAFERETRLGAIQRLDLALFVATEHDGAFGWIQIQSHDTD